MNRMDQIAREKLLQHEIKPSAAAWEQVNRQLTGKRTPYYLYWSAAVILLAMTIGISVILRQDREIVITAAVDSPMERKVPLITWSEVPSTVIMQTPVASVAMVEKKSADRVLKEMPEQAEPVFINTEISLAKVTVMPLDPIMPQLPDPFWMKAANQEEHRIIIRYIASNQGDNIEKPLIEKLLTLAQQSTPANLISDIREAKGDMFKNKASVY